MAQRIRLTVDRLTKRTTYVSFGGSPSIWNNSPLDVEFGILANGVVESVSGYSSIAVIFKPQTRRGASIVNIEVAAADLNQTLTTEEWAAGILYHGLAEFSEQDMNVDMLIQDKRTFWIAIVGTDLLTGKPVMLGGTNVSIEESGINLEGNHVAQGGNLISGGAVYNGSGQYVVAVSQDYGYSYAQGANDTSLVNGVQTITDDDIFTANGASVTLNGTIGLLVTATLRRQLSMSYDQALALISSDAILTTNVAGRTATFVSPDGTRKVTFGAQDDGNPLINPQAV